MFRGNDNKKKSMESGNYLITKENYLPVSRKVLSSPTRGDFFPPGLRQPNDFKKRRKSTPP
jgi:hypothetical protein